MSTRRQDLDRQLDALGKAGIPADRIYTDKKSGANTDRPGLTNLLDYARAGDVIVAYTLDRLGRSVRDTLNMIADLTDRGVGLRTLADPIKIDTASETDATARLAVVLLSLFAEMERTYNAERVAHARSVAVAKGRQVGRPVKASRDQLEYAVHLRNSGHSISEIIAKTGIPRTSLYRHLPPRPPEHTGSTPSTPPR